MNKAGNQPSIEGDSSHSDDAAREETQPPPSAKPYDAPAQEELIARARGGDQKAFESLVLGNYDRVYTVALHMLRSEADARDVLQDAFIRVQRGLADFQGQSKFSTWLYRVVVNLCLDRLRHKKRWAKSEPETLDALSATGGTPESLASDSEMGRVLKAGLEQLSDMHRATFLLFEVEGLSYEDIAQATGVRIGTVMSRLFYARQKMREFVLQHTSG